MKMPGFNAEASLCRSNENYRVTESLNQIDGEVQLALQVTTKCHWERIQLPQQCSTYRGPNGPIHICIPGKMSYIRRCENVIV
jgi:hypothetical protein